MVGHSTLTYISTGTIVCPVAIGRSKAPVNLQCLVLNGFQVHLISTQWKSSLQLLCSSSYRSGTKESQCIHVLKNKANQHSHKNWTGLKQILHWTRCYFPTKELWIKPSKLKAIIEITWLHKKITKMYGYQYCQHISSLLNSKTPQILCLRITTTSLLTFEDKLPVMKKMLVFSFQL